MNGRFCGTKYESTPTDFSMSVGVSICFLKSMMGRMVNRFAISSLRTFPFGLCFFLYSSIAAFCVITAWRMAGSNFA